MYVRLDGRGFPGQLGLHHDGVIDGLRELVDVAHANGALIGPQLYHAGRQTSSASTGTTPVAPSPIPDPLMGEVPVELTIDDIADLVRCFGDAARRSEAAGCDFVQIHGAHGYLVTQFLSPFTNRRTDEYGGDAAGRRRFLLEIIEAVRSETSDGFPIIVRLSGDELVPGGLTIEDTVELATELEQRGVDVIDISAGNYASFTRGSMIAPMARDDGLLEDLAAKVRDAVSVPVVAVGKIRTPDLAERMLVEGSADLIALGRQLLADPAWPAKAEAGEVDTINHCLACSQACIGRLFQGEHVRCTVNPVCGFEEDLAQAPEGPPRRLAVIGGGPGGMQAAVTAAQRGHQVTLLERDDHLGGQLIAAAATPTGQAGRSSVATWRASSNGSTSRCGWGSKRISRRSRHSSPTPWCWPRAPARHDRTFRASMTTGSTPRASSWKPRPPRSVTSWSPVAAAPARRPRSCWPCRAMT